MAVAKMTLPELKAEVKSLLDFIETEFNDTPALRFVKQKLQEAASGVDQELRNVRIDAEMALKKLEGKK
jgi:hypothetical protein